MGSSPDYRKEMRHAHKSIVLFADEQSDYFSYAHMSNWSSSGMYFESDVALRPDTKIQIRFDNEFNWAGGNTLRSVVRWCRELAYDDSEYAFGIGVKFI